MYFLISTISQIYSYQTNKLSWVVIKRNNWVGEIGLEISLFALINKKRVKQGKVRIKKRILNVYPSEIPIKLINSLGFENIETLFSYLAYRQGNKFFESKYDLYNIEKVK